MLEDSVPACARATCSAIQYEVLSDIEKGQSELGLLQSL